MKKFFTLIAAVAMAASMNAQTFKSFAETTVFITNQENVTAGLLRVGLLRVVDRLQLQRLVALILRLVRRRLTSSLVSM